jgi:hypothetical protein
MAARLSALRAGRFSPPGKFLVLISVRRWVDPRAIVRLEELGKLKKSTSSGTLTRDLPACSIVPQPTTLPRAPRYVLCLNSINLCSIWGRRICEHEGYCFLMCDGVESEIQRHFGGTYCLQLQGGWVREASERKEEGERVQFGLLLEDGSGASLRNVCEFLEDCTASHARR